METILLNQLIVCIVGIFGVRQVYSEYVSENFRKFPNYISENRDIKNKNNGRILIPDIKSTLKESETAESKKKNVDLINVSENVKLSEESKKSFERTAVIRVLNNKENYDKSSKNTLNENLQPSSSNIDKLKVTEIANRPNVNLESENSHKIKVMEIEKNSSNDTFDDNITGIIIDLEDIKNGNNVENINYTNNTTQEKTNNFNDTKVMIRSNSKNENFERRNLESENLHKIKVMEIEKNSSNDTFDDNITGIIIDLEDIKNGNISDTNNTSQEKSNNFNDTKVMIRNNSKNENFERQKIWNDEKDQDENINSEIQMEKRRIFNNKILDLISGNKEKQNFFGNLHDENILDNRNLNSSNNTKLIKENTNSNVSTKLESSDEETAIRFLIKQEMASVKCQYKSNHGITNKNYTGNFSEDIHQLLSGTTLADLDRENLIQLGKAKLTMRDLYWKSKIVPYHLRGLKQKYWRKHYPLMGYLDLRRKFSTSRDFNELQYYWLSWRHITRKPMRDSFKTYVEITTSNENPKNENASWFSNSQSLSRMQILRLYKEIMPFYKNLHAYIRKRLIKQYQPKKFRKQGPIPEHLLGDISAHEWTNIESIVRPYPNKKSLKICRNVENRNISAREIAKVAENFFRSLGFDKLDEKFWMNSIFHTISENCTTKVILKCNNRNYGLDACLDPECYFFSMIYWTSIAYQLNYSFDINSEISEAIAQLMSLSIATPRYLFSVGLSETEEYNKYEEINLLMETALRIVPSIMDALSVGLWRDEIMSGVISLEDMNEKFWKHRLYYQGLCPPVRRNEKDFDAGAVKSVANDFNIMKNFLGGILQFQFHKGLCLVSAQSGLFHRCNLFKSTEAGDRIRKLLKLGRSVTIADALSIMADGEKEISASPMIEYFKPLYEWLLIQNEFDQVGWESNDAIVCSNCLL